MLYFAVNENIVSNCIVKKGAQLKYTPLIKIYMFKLDGWRPT